MQPANRMVLRLHCLDRSRKNQTTLVLGREWKKKKRVGAGGVAVDGGGFSELGRRFERITFSELGARVRVEVSR